jgi:vancomycin resistance protein VanJ
MTKWSRGSVIAVLAVLATLLLIGHKYVPNSPGNLGSLLETFLPWIGLTIPALLVLAIWRRSVPAITATALASVAWLAMFGHLILPGKGGGPHDLRVLTHNIKASNPDPASTAQALLAYDADIIALQELTPEALNQARSVLNSTYPYQTSGGTVALWSKQRLATTDSVDIGMGWTRALRAQAQTPAGPVAIYVAHLASVRVGSEGFTSDQRDRTINDLGEAIAAEKLQRVIVMGDLNGTAYDRSLAPLTFGLTSVQAEAGWGFGFTWPAKFPMARIDHILIRGMTATDAKILPATASDHRPISADLKL